MKQEDALAIVDRFIANELDAWPVPMAELSEAEADGLADAIALAIVRRIDALELPDDERLQLREALLQASIEGRFR